MSENQFLAQQQFLNNVIKPMILNEMSNNKKQVTYPAIVENVYDNSMSVDVRLDYGSEPVVLQGISNKTNTVLSIDDVVEVSTGISGDLSNCYISRSYNQIQSLIGENIVGVLSFGNKSNSNGEILFYEAALQKLAMKISNYAINFYDWGGTNANVGEIAVYRTDYPLLSLTANNASSVAICTRDTNGNDNIQFEIRNNTYDNDIRTIVASKCYIAPDGYHVLQIGDTDNGNAMWGHISHKGWDVVDVGNLKSTNLVVSGSKNCVQSTENFGDRLFYSYELADSWLGDIGYGKINNGECVIAINPVVIESINVDNSYIIKIFPLENCNWKITEQTPFYFVVTADKDIEFSWEIMAKRRGFENERLEYADNIKSNLNQPQEKNMLLEDLNNENISLINNSLFNAMNNDSTVLEIKNN